ncbi:MAG: glycosyltransferase family A protein, partial [Chlamydiota bacterium]|nr:glycosyltransferase family A protein [Chlamydiota bacterium]
MTDRPSLSCIIPTYNRSDYVRECLLALQKSGVSDLEIIVSDDGSTDDTREVVETTNLSAKYLWHPNIGAPATPRNVAFTNSYGRIVGFLDCDDQWIPGMPAKIVSLFDRYPEVDVIFADARMGN